jgi:hypothetical protein
MGSAPGGSGGGTPSSGGGAADPATGGGSAPALVAPDAGAPSCTCTPSGVYACVAAVRACMAATDCPADWTCRDNPDGACWRSSDGDGGCLPADPPKVCAPPYSDLPGIGGVPTRGTTGTTNPPGATPGGENTGSSAGRSSGCSMAGRALGGPGDWLAALGLLGLGVRHLRRLRPRRR